MPSLGPLRSTAALASQSSSQASSSASSNRPKFPLKLAHRVFKAALYGYQPQYKHLGFKPDKDRKRPHPWKQHLHPDLWPENNHKRETSLTPLPSYKEFQNLLRLDAGTSSRSRPARQSDRTAAKHTKPYGIHTPPNKRAYSTSRAAPGYNFGLDTLNKQRRRLVALSPESIKPGDWIDSRKYGPPATQGLVIHVEGDKVFVLDLRGSVLSCAARSQEVAWPGLVDPKAAAAVWSGDMRSIAPDTDDPSEAFKATVDWNQLSQHAEAARKLVPVMRDFTQALEDMHRLASKLGIDDLYDTFRNPDEDEHGSLSYEDAAQHLIRLAADRLPHKVFTNMDRALLSYVVFAHMILRPLYFTSGTEAREAATFSLTPLTWVKDLQTATAWMESQDSNSPLDSFIEKAREIVTFSEKYPPTRYAKSCQPFAESAALPNFNANDQLIIRVLKRALITERQSQMPIYADILSNVVQHLAVPEPGTPLVNLNVAVLKRLGAITPWENLVKLDPNLAPWGDKLPKLPRTHVLRSTDAPEAHAVDAVRHDFGTMPVYVIDADDAYELDDGVSIEQAPPANGQPSWWVHAHVADPTHCLPPKDVRAYKAFRRKETVYFPEKTWPLLPRNFLAQHHLSLGSAPEQRVMTFSTRMTGDGEVLGSLVRAGIVRNVVKTTYNVVSEILSGSPTKPSTPRMILSTFPTEKDLQDALGSNKLERNLSEVSASGREDLKQLYSLARAHMRKRVARGGIFWEYSSPSVNIYRSSKDTPIDDDKPERPYLYKGIPRVSMSIPGPGASLEPSDEESTILNPAGVLVSEMMIVANSSAAQHGRQHGLPLPFLGQKQPATTPEALQALYEERDPMTGRIPVRSLLDASSKVQFPAAYTSNKPVAHWALGIPEETGYTRVTSPLRRNLDLFTHWMLKGSLVKDFPTPRLTPELEDFYAQPAGRIRRLGNRATQHWINYVLSQEYKRWEDEGAAKHPHLEKLFTGLEGVVQRPPAFAVFSSQWHTAVFVPSLGIKVAAECGPRGPTLAVGDIVNIRLTAFRASDFPSIEAAIVS